MAAEHVPKFSSFDSSRLRSLQDRGRSDTDSQRSYGAVTGAKNNTTSSSSSSRDKLKKHGSHSRDSRAGSGYGGQSKSGRGVSHEQHVEAPGLFKIDVKGDRDNLVYGTNYRYSIPQYRRYGQGRVLGLGYEWRIKQPDGPQVVVERMPGTRDKRAAAFPRVAEKSRRIQHMPPAARGAEEQPFGAYVRVGRPRHELREARMREIWEDSSEASDSSDDLAAAEAEMAEQQQQKRITSLTQRAAELSRLTEENKSDVESWLKLARIQDDLAAAMTGTKVSASANTAAIKISIFEKALSSITDPAVDVTSLVAAYVDVKAKAVSGREAKDMFAKFLAQFPTCLPLWQYHFDSLLTNANEYSFSDMQVEFDKSYGILRSAMPKWPELTEKLEVCFAYVLARHIRVMRRAGYSELAQGALRAVLTMNLTGESPQNTQLIKSRLEHGKLFTTAEETSFHNDFFPSLLGEGANDPDLQNAWLTWAIEEDRLEKDAAHPRDIRHINDQDDPYSFVMWAEISSIFLKYTSPMGEELLYHLSLGTAGNILAQRRFCELLSSVDANVRCFDIFDLSCSDIYAALVGTDTAFTDMAPLSILEHVYACSPECSIAPFASLPSQIGSVLEILHMLITSSSDICKKYRSEWLCQTLLILSKQDSSKTRSHARRLLKTHGECFPLWITFCLLQYELDGPAAARKSFASLYSMSRDACDMIGKWATSELIHSHASAAKRIVVSYTQKDPAVQADLRDEPVSKSAMLRARDTLTQQYAHALSQGENDLALSTATCLCVLAYSEEGDLNDILTIVKAVGETFTRPTLAYEVFLTRTLAIFRHVCHTIRVYRRGDVISFLQICLRASPANALFLDLIYRVEARMQLGTSVAFHAGTDTASLVHSLFSAWAESRRPTGSEQQRLLNTRNVLSHANVTCVELHAVVALLNLACGAPADAYDASMHMINDSPWYKLAYLIALATGTQTRADKQPARLAQIYYMMLENGLRIHHEQDDSTALVGMAQAASAEASPDGPA